MSLTSRERRNPPTRRKSCVACIKAKRRCDFALPACMRCANRNITCEYPLRKSRVAAMPQAAEEEVFQFPQDQVDDFSLLEDDLPGAPSRPLVHDILATPDLTHDNPFSQGLDFDLDLSPLPMDLVPRDMVVSSLAGAPPITSGPVFDLIQSQLRYALDETRKAPSMMAEELATPWSHPMLYRDSMPKAIRGNETMIQKASSMNVTDHQVDVHACCCMYVMKTTTNSPIILRSIESYVDDLLRSPPPATVHERLAHAQALLLYHIIRLLDGDLRSRSHAERQLDNLEDCIMALLPDIEFDITGAHEGGLPLHPIGATKLFWRNWILQESARRTLLFGLFFLQAYRIVAGLVPVHCDEKLLMCRSLTVSSHLWDANTPVAFAQAWNQKRYFVVSNCSFHQVIEDAVAEDVDSFGKIMMTACMGVEEAEGWFAARGAMLQASGHSVAVS